MTETNHTVAEVHLAVDDIWAAGRGIRYRYYVAAAKIYGSGGRVAFGSLGVTDDGITRPRDFIRSSHELSIFFIRCDVTALYVLVTL